VEEDHVRTRRRVETCAHRDELESRPTFLGVVEAAKPAADLDAVSGRRTWRRRTAPTSGALSDYGKRQRKYDNCRKPPMHRSSCLPDEEAVSYLKERRLTVRSPARGRARRSRPMMRRVLVSGGIAG